MHQKKILATGVLEIIQHGVKNVVSTVNNFYYCKVDFWSISNCLFIQYQFTTYSCFATIIQVLLNSSSIFQKFSSIQKIYFKVF